MFSFCELFYAHTKCFSSGPLVFAGPIFMNHREQALARLRSHPAQLKHKRDKHKGIWSSLSIRWDTSPVSSTHLNFVSGKMHKPNSSTWLLSLYSLRRKNMMKDVLFVNGCQSHSFLFVNFNKTFCNVSFSLPFLFQFHKVEGRWKNNYCFLFLSFIICSSMTAIRRFIVLFKKCFRINKITKFSV